MTSESKLKLLDQLLETKDREESIMIAQKLFPEMSLEEITAVVDESLAGYQET